MNKQKFVLSETQRFINALDEQFEIPREQKDFISGYLSAWLDAAEHHMQRTAFGAGWHVRLANKIIGFGWWLADNGNR